MQMAYHGTSNLKRWIQSPFSLLGYKIVQKKPYEAQMPHRKKPADLGFNKVFCIGFNKTGTTTLEAVLRQHGLAMPKQLDQETTLQHVLDNKSFDVLGKFLAEYDAVQDVPFSQQRTYITCDALFPGSKFILTVRDPDEWVDSYINYYGKEFEIGIDQAVSEETFQDKNLYLEKNYVHRLLSRSLASFNGTRMETVWQRAFDRDYLKSRFNERNAEITWYFNKRPQDLLVIDVTTEKDTGRLLSFLGLDDGLAAPFPKLNAGSKPDAQKNSS